MAVYKPEEIVDILLQKEDRVTAGLLEEPVVDTGFFASFKRAVSSLVGNKDVPRETGCVLNAMEELSSIGMPDGVINAHVHKMFEVLDEEHTNAMGLYAMRVDDVVFYNQVHRSLAYRLGVKHLDVHNKEQDGAIMEILEERMRGALVEILSNAVEKMPELVTTSAPHVNEASFKPHCKPK